MKSRLYIARRLAVFALVMLAAMEVAARLHDYALYRAPIFSNYDFEKLFYSDGKVVRGVPHARYAKWALNSIGMRGPEPRPMKGQTRIVIYGASEVFGIYESDNHEFPRLLENDLNRRFPGTGFEVFNAGIPGMRVGSGTEYLKEIGRSLSPSVVIIYPTPTHYIGTTRPNCGRTDRKAYAQGAFEWPASRLLAKSVDQAKAIVPKPLLTMARKKKIARDIGGSAELQSVDEVSLAAMRYDMVCAVRQVKEIGAMPVLLTHANRFGNVQSADDDYWLTGWRAQYPELAEKGFLPLERRANEIIKDVASGEGVRLVDLDAALSGDRANFADHAHFSDRGAEMVAQVLTEALAWDRLPTDKATPAQPAIVATAVH